jgi:hypothetical protein
MLIWIQVQSMGEERVSHRCGKCAKLDAVAVVLHKAGTPATVSKRVEA